MWKTIEGFYLLWLMQIYYDSKGNQAIKNTVIRGYINKV